MRSKVAIFGLTFPLIMVFDFMSKRWALDALGARSSEIFGGLVPLTLAYNKGAAFGVRLGEDSRWFFVPVTIIALVLLGVLFKQAADAASSLRSICSSNQKEIASSTSAMMVTGTKNHLESSPRRTPKAAPLL